MISHSITYRNLTYSNQHCYRKLTVVIVVHLLRVRLGERQCVDERVPSVDGELQ